MPRIGEEKPSQDAEDAKFTELKKRNEECKQQELVIREQQNEMQDIFRTDFFDVVDDADDDSDGAAGMTEIC